MNKNFKVLIILLIISITLFGLYEVDKNIKQNAYATLSYREFIPEESPIQQEYYVFEATAYTLYECNGSGYTSTMTKPVQGRTIAVDPSVIPYGSNITINGVSGFVAEDCGGLIKGNKIDIFMNNYDDAINFGKQYVIVTID